MSILSYSRRLLRSMKSPLKRRKSTFEIYDVITFLRDRGELKAGDKGTIVYIQSIDPAIFTVEFMDSDGVTIDLPDLPDTELINITSSDET